MIAECISSDVHEEGGTAPVTGAPLRLERAVEMLFHAYNYVRRLDPDAESGADDLLGSKYKELKRKERPRSRVAPRIHNRQRFPKEDH